MDEIDDSRQALDGGRFEAIEATGEKAERVVAVLEEFGFGLIWEESRPTSSGWTTSSPTSELRPAAGSGGCQRTSEPAEPSGRVALACARRKSGLDFDQAMDPSGSGTERAAHDGDTRVG